MIRPHFTIKEIKAILKEIHWAEMRGKKHLNSAKGKLLAEVEKFKNKGV